METFGIFIMGSLVGSFIMGVSFARDIILMHYYKQKLDNRGVDCSEVESMSLWEMIKT